MKGYVKEFLSFFFQTYFTGKLILHDPPGLTSNGSGGPSSMTSTLLATQAACMMPSPAEQVTDDLISPKYDTNDETTEDEDDSDDTVYECPGLAATGEMVVSNPFFLQGHSQSDPLSHLEAAGIEPKPISQSSIFHHGIKGVN